MDEVLRRSQIITNFGVGAITDMREFSGVLKSPDVWQVEGVPVLKLINEERVEEVRLVNRLRGVLINPSLEYFVMPPRKRDEGKSIKLPFTLFPRMLYCKICGRLKSFEEWFPKGLDYANNLKCTEKKNKKTCNGKLIPSRFIMICPKGHIDDFPYNNWVHRSNDDCGDPNLRIRFQGGGSSLDSIIIKCENCNSSRSLAGALKYKNHSEDLVCRGNRPELYKKGNPHIEGCGTEARHLKFVLRNASNVYFAKIYSSISIPPLASTIVNEILAHNLFITIRDAKNDNDDALFNAAKNKALCLWSEQYNKEPLYFETLLSQLLDNNAPEQDEEQYRFAEFNAFQNETDGDQTNFVIQNVEVSEELKKYHISVIRKAIRIREVRVLAGYSRVRPNDLVAENIEVQGENVTMRSALNRVVNIADQNSKIKFLPGIETYGEGIFLSFNNDIFQQKSSLNTIVQRINRFNINMGRNIQDGGRQIPFNAKYIALHTLSHLLIRRLSFESGYPISSIRERIYCDVQHGNIMSGIFLYTVDMDSEGTMGGLCRLADSKYLEDIISIALEESDWCSSDPVCRESIGQGLGSLNLAACHSCCLLPETSCELGNRLLDRNMCDLFFRNEKI